MHYDVMSILEFGQSLVTGMILMILMPVSNLKLWNMASAVTFEL